MIEFANGLLEAAKKPLPRPEPKPKAAKLAVTVAAAESATPETPAEPAAEAPVVAEAAEVSAEVAPEDLYTDGPLAHEFPRTVSRLNEMQSGEYLSLEHRTVDTGLT